MSDKTTATPASTRPEPFKRVKYSLGMVLGVDEFDQEQAYFKERDRLQNRALHGYGTVWGLDVSVEAVSRIRVKPGLAVDRLGREICVPEDQCADLSAWVSRADNKVLLPADGNGTADVFVTLCYRECLTDKVPVPGAPCRTEAEAMAPSRITESFALRLGRQKPAMAEVAEIRQFVRLLNRIEVWRPGQEVVDRPEAFSAEGEIVKRPEAFSAKAEIVKEAAVGPVLAEKAGIAKEILVGATLGDKVIIAKPETVYEEITPATIRTKVVNLLSEANSTTPLRIMPPTRLEDVLQAAYEAWILRRRAALHPKCAEVERLDASTGGACCDDHADSQQDECVLLAELKVTFEGGAVKSVEPVITERPFLFHTQLLQELLQRQSVHSHLTGLRNDDHPQYLLVKPDAPHRRSLIHDLDCGNHRLTRVHDATQDDDAIVWSQRYEGWTGVIPTGSDLGGSYRHPQVIALQGVPVSATKPAAVGEQLTFNGREWEPQAEKPHEHLVFELTSVTEAGALVKLLSKTALRKLGEVKAALEKKEPAVIAVWFHPYPPAERAPKVNLESVEKGLTVWDVLSDGGWRRVEATVLQEVTPNQFMVALLHPADRAVTLGLRFDLDQVLVDDGRTLAAVLAGVEKPIGTITDTTPKPADGTEVKPADGIVVKPADGIEVKPTDGIGVRPTDDIVRPGEVLDVRPTDGIVLKPAEGIDVRPTDDTVLKPADGIEVKPTDGMVLKPAEGIDVRPTDGVVLKPADGIEVKPTDGLVLKPAEGIDVRPTDGVVLKPVEGTVLRPVDGTVVQPVEGIVPATGIVIPKTTEGVIRTTSDAAVGTVADATVIRPADTPVVRTADTTVVRAETTVLRTTVAPTAGLADATLLKPTGVPDGSVAEATLLKPTDVPIASVADATLLKPTEAHPTPITGAVVAPVTEPIVSKLPGTTILTATGTPGEKAPEVGPVVLPGRPIGSEIVVLNRPLWLGHRGNIVVDYYQFVPMPEILPEPVPQPVPQPSPVTVVAAGRFTAKGEPVGEQVGRIQTAEILEAGLFVLAVEPLLEPDATHVVKGSPILVEGQAMGVFEQVSMPNFPAPKYLVIRSAALMSKGVEFDPRNPLGSVTPAGFDIEISRVVRQ